MKRRFAALLLLLGLCAGAAGAGWFYSRSQAAQELVRSTMERLGLAPGRESGGLTVSGTISANRAIVAAEMGGRILAIGADEGQPVQAGEVLVQLDDALLQGQIRQAEADLAVAEARLAQARAGVRPEKLAVAEAQLAQAEVAQEAARVAWEDAQAMRDHPQDLELALTAAQSQLGVLSWQQQQAQALANSADAANQFADEAIALLEGMKPRDEWVLLGTFDFEDLPPEIPVPPDLPDGECQLGRYKIVISGGIVQVYVHVTIGVPVDLVIKTRFEQAMTAYQAWEAWTGVEQAETAVEGVKAYLEQLRGQVENPLSLEARANAAEAQYKIAKAAVGAARVQLDGLELGATPAQIAALEAQVEAARAALQALQAQAAKFTLRAPLTGVVLERNVHVGELALPGAPLLTLADLDQVILTVYVPESQLGLAALGQEVQVTVDAYPGQVFTGTVTYVASRAEFTPKNVQTREERTNMVFAVKVTVPNAEQSLKPGMPADAHLAPGSAPRR